MYIMKNALRNIQRSKGRSILFAVIVFIIALSACLSLSIRAAAETTRAQGLEQLAITGNITLDMDEIMGEKNGEPPDRSEMKESMQDSELSLEELQKYAKLDSVKSFWYTGSVSVDASKIEAVSTSEGGMGGRMMGGAMGQSDGDFTITGYSSDEAMTDFTDGNAEITDGVMFEEGTSEKTCVISSTLAKYNDLEVGDSIKFVNPSDTSKTFKVKIVGIYSSGSSSPLREAPSRSTPSSCCTPRFQPSLTAQVWICGLREHIRSQTTMLTANSKTRPMRPDSTANILSGRRISITTKDNCSLSRTFRDTRSTSSSSF